MVMASVGHASAQARHSSRHLEVSTMGRPRKRSGKAGTCAGYETVRCPCFSRASAACSMRSPLGEWQEKVALTLRVRRRPHAEREEYAGYRDCCLSHYRLMMQQHRLTTML